MLLNSEIYKEKKEYMILYDLWYSRSIGVSVEKQTFISMLAGHYVVMQLLFTTCLSSCLVQPSSNVDQPTLFSTCFPSWLTNQSTIQQLTLSAGYIITCNHKLITNFYSIRVSINNTFQQNKKVLLFKFNSLASNFFSGR